VKNGNSVPEHVAIIMDGNGRWAKQRGLPRVAGHKAGAEAVRRALQAAADHGVEVLTIYAFSSENWRRSDEEISDLTALMRFYLERELKTLEKERVRLKLIGDYSAFGPELVERLERAVERTAGNDRLTLVIALNYGSRAEIAGAARKLAADVAEDFLLLGLGERIDLLDRVVGQLLHLMLEALALVLADLVLLLVLLEVVHAVAAHIADCDASLLGILANELGELLAAFLGQLGNGQTDNLAVRNRIEPEAC